MFSSQQNEAESPFLLSFWCFASFWSNAAEFFTVTQNKVHVFVKCHESADKNPAILQSDAHPIVQMLL
jgi:hypothetical protein